VAKGMIARLFAVGALAMAAFAAAGPDIQMVLVKGGCYQMGDTFGDGQANEKPEHQVCVDDFSIGKYVVTQAQWQAVMGNNPSSFKDCGGDCPVEQVSWQEVQEFIAKLNRLSGRHYRLPTEAEWEYAARSGGKHERWAGTSEKNQLGEYAWYIENSDEKTHVVGQKQPNGLGLYDMSGNVGQWLQDRYDSAYYEKSPKGNPEGPPVGSARVVRGGSWGGAASKARVAYRNYPYDPSSRYSLIGFRLVLPAH
jgi:formylglycine-generating enzyme